MKIGNKIGFGQKKFDKVISISISVKYGKNLVSIRKSFDRNVLSTSSRFLIRITFS